MRWRNIDDEKPNDGQECLTEMKHGFISGQYCAADRTFGGYYWRAMEWYASRWVPTEELMSDDHI